MSRNLEIKVSTGNNSPVEKLLRNSGINRTAVLNQKDIYYKVPGYLLKLRIQGEEYQLVKYRRDESAEKRWSDYDILFLKGENPEQYLSSLFEIEVIVEKRRELYMYRNVRIHLDEVKGLGYFLELESVHTGSDKETEDNFREAFNKLELDKYEELRKSYRDMKF